MQSPDFEKSHLYISEESIKCLKKILIYGLLQKISDTAKDKYTNYSKIYY